MIVWSHSKSGGIMIHGYMEAAQVRSGDLWLIDLSKDFCMVRYCRVLQYCFRGSLFDA